MHGPVRSVEKTLSPEEVVPIFGLTLTRILKRGVDTECVRREDCVETDGFLLWNSTPWTGRTPSRTGKVKE